MNQILTDEELWDIHCKEDDTVFAYGRGVITAYETKLREENEPVAWLHKGRLLSDVITDEVRMFLLRESERYKFQVSMQRCPTNKAEHYTIPLFEHPVSNTLCEELKYAKEEITSLKYDNEELTDALKDLKDSIFNVISSKPNPLDRLEAYLADQLGDEDTRSVVSHLLDEAKQELFATTARLNEYIIKYDRLVQETT